MKISVTPLNDGTISVRALATLYYIDYYSVCDGEIHCDMGFELNEIQDTRNENSLEENIKDVKFGAKEYFEESKEYLEDGEIYIYEVIVNDFEDVNICDTEEEVEEVKEYIPLWGMKPLEDCEPKTVFRCATCTKEYADEIGLEKLVGKVDYYTYDSKES